MNFQTRKKHKWNVHNIRGIQLKQSKFNTTDKHLEIYCKTNSFYLKFLLMLFIL